MKGLGIFVALFAAVVALTPGPAQAYRGATPVAAVGLTEGNAVRYRRDGDRRYEGGRRWHRERRVTRERRYSNGARWGWRTNCNTQWRNGHRERVCRRVRYRR